MPPTKNESVPNSSDVTESTKAPSEAQPATLASTSERKPPALRIRLREALKPFSDKEVQKKPGRGGGPELKYVSHGSVTKRLIDIDPTYGLEVKESFVIKDDKGRLHCEGVLVRLSFTDEEDRVCVIEEFGGAQRVGITQKGTTDGFATEAKNAMSDAIKRASMRRGIGLGMWEELIDAAYDEDVRIAEEPAHSAGGEKSKELIERFNYLLNIARQAGIPLDDLDKRCLQLYGDTADRLELVQTNDVISRIEAKLPNAQPPTAQPPSSSNGTGAGGGITEKQMGKLWATANEKGVSTQDIHDFIAGVFGKSSIRELNKTEAGACIEWLLEQPDHHVQSDLVPGDFQPVGGWEDADRVYRTP